MYLSIVKYLGPHTEVTAHELTLPGAYASALVIFVKENFETGFHESRVRSGKNGHLIDVQVTTYNPD